MKFSSTFSPIAYYLESKIADGKKSRKKITNISADDSWIKHILLYSPAENGTFYDSEKSGKWVSKVRLPWSASPTGIQRCWTYSENLGMENPVKSRVPAILSTVSNQRLCPTQLDCEINRIRLKLHTLYATVPLTSQAVHFRVSPKTRILVYGKEKTLLVTMRCGHKVGLILKWKEQLMAKRRPNYMLSGKLK